MTNPHSPQRLAARTFAIGLGIDLTVACTLVLAAAVTDIRWTKEYWLALGLSLSRTIIQTAVAYMVRKFVLRYQQNGGRGDTLYRGTLNRPRE